MLSGVAETFANWKLRNKSDVNETDMTYVCTTLAHFIFKKNEGVNESVAEGVSKYLPKNAMKLRKFPYFCWGGGRSLGCNFYKKKKNLNLKCLTIKRVDKEKCFSLS